MLKRYNIDINTEQIRKKIYDKFVKHLDGWYTFINNSDYIWFKENVIEQQDKYSIIVGYSESEIEFEWGKMIRICIISINDFIAKIDTKEIELVGYFDQKLPKFEKESKGE